MIHRICVSFGQCVFVGPPFILDFTTVRQLDEGDPVELRCEAHIQYVDQTVNFQWVRYGEDGKGMPISGTDSDDRVTTTSFKDTNRSHFFYGTLRLNSVSRVDSGSYACRISGSVGTSSLSASSVNVNVKCNVTTHCHTMHTYHFQVDFHFRCA